MTVWSSAPLRGTMNVGVNDNHTPLADWCPQREKRKLTRPAQVGDKVIARLFKSGTRGFCAPEDKSVAVCLLPGTIVLHGRTVTAGAFVAVNHERDKLQDRDLPSDRLATNPAIHHDALRIPGWTDCSLDVPGRGSNGHGSPLAGGSC